MATTTKSTRSRTAKTTKKPARATKAVAAKTTKKTKVATKSAAKTTKTAVKKAPAAAKNNANKVELTPIERIRSIHISSALSHLIFAALIIGFATIASTAVRLGLQTRDQFASQGNVVLGPANEVLYNINPKYVLAGSLVLGALASILLASKFRSRYESTVANRTSGFRWLALGLSAALLITYINLLAGISDWATLKLSAGLIFVTALLSFVAERENVGAVRPKWVAFDLSLLTGVLAWLPLLGSIFGTSVYGMERYGWHVYALAVITMLGFTLTALNQYRHFKKGALADYEKAEERYLRIDTLTKFAVVLITLTAFNQ